MSAAKNYDSEIGMKYSRLTVNNWFRKSSIVFYECVCDCGKPKVARRCHIVNNLIESCGCLRSEILTKRNTKHSGTDDPIYRIWRGIVWRARGKVNDKQPNYIGCTICEDWDTNYLSFKGWFESQLIKYEGYCGFDFEVDKDLLIEDNKHYSPETCVVVPSFVNRFLTSRHNYRGNYALGVSKYKGEKKFKANISICGEQTYLGSFITEKEAHKAWQAAKIAELKRLQSLLPKEISQTLNRVLCKLENAYNTNMFINKL